MVTYISTHIRLHAPGYRRSGGAYQQMIGWQNAEDSATFTKEVVNILGSMGFAVQGNHPAAISACGACPTVERGKESLYLHPDDLSGWLAEGSLAEIVEALKVAKTCHVRHVDENERKVDYTIDEYKRELSKHEAVIRERWLDRLSTSSKRRAYVRSSTSINTRDLANPMDEVGDYRAKNMLKAAYVVASNCVTGPILDRLIAEGLVESTVRPEPYCDVCVRTRGKTELAALHRSKRKAALTD